MSQRCDKHRYSHVSESSCRQCLIDEQADTIATQHTETVALRYVGERADSKIKALQERNAELEEAMEKIKRVSGSYPQDTAVYHAAFKALKGSE
jgi:hypothetical protein